MTLQEKQRAMLADLFYERSTTDDALWLQRLNDKIVELHTAIEGSNETTI